jgi:hypothetical protein
MKPILELKPIKKNLNSVFDTKAISGGFLEGCGLTLAVLKDHSTNRPKIGMSIEEFKEKFPSIYEDCINEETGLFDKNKIYSISIKIPGEGKKLYKGDVFDEFWAHIFKNTTLDEIKKPDQTIDFKHRFEIVDEEFESEQFIKISKLRDTAKKIIEEYKFIEKINLLSVFGKRIESTSEAVITAQCLKLLDSLANCEKIVHYSKNISDFNKEAFIKICIREGFVNLDSENKFKYGDITLGVTEYDISKFLDDSKNAAIKKELIEKVNNWRSSKFKME